MAAKNTVKLSLPESREVRGYEICRMPLGPMLGAIEKIQGLPGDLMTACFPGMDPKQILTQLKGFNAQMLLTIFGQALTVAPKHLIKVFSGLCGIPEKAFLTDPAIGLDGILEMVSAWIEVNGIENFLQAARPLMEKIKAAAGSFRLRNTGSNA